MNFALIRIPLFIEQVILRIGCNEAKVTVHVTPLSGHAKYKTLGLEIVVTKIYHKLVELDFLCAGWQAWEPLFYNL